eukprot:5908274-Pyramimonas_sp.AAC.1
MFTQPGREAWSEGLQNCAAVLYLHGRWCSLDRSSAFQPPVVCRSSAIPDRCGPRATKRSLSESSLTMANGSSPVSSRHLLHRLVDANIFEANAALDVVRSVT